MIYRKLEEIHYPFLHDAVYCTMWNYTVDSVYMDKEGSCAIRIKGNLTDEDAVRIQQNFYPEDKSLSEIEPDYANHKNGIAEIYTPDGIDYRTL